jgi:hypothetical protein
MENQELEILRSDVAKQALAVQVITRVSSQEEYNNANNVLSAIKSTMKSLKARKDALINPIKQHIDILKSIFVTTEEKLEDAEKRTKAAMIDFSDREDERVRKEQEILAKQEADILKKQEAGKLKDVTAERKIEEIAVKKDEIVIQKNTVKSEVGSSTIKMERKFRIVDETKIPRKYLTPDMVKIRFDAIGSKERKPIDIPGVEVYEEKNLSAKSLW